jgi:hypothetical protein
MERIGGALTLLALLATPLSACGDEKSRARALAQSVAADFRKECDRASAPNAATRRHLLRLCACAETKVAATPMRWGESDASINEKIQAAKSACRAELDGTPAKEAGRPERFGTRH